MTAHTAAMAALGRRVHDLRAERGLSLQELAGLARLTAPVLSALERGEEHVPLIALVAIADALGLPLASVVADAPAPPPQAPASQAPEHREPVAAYVTAETVPVRTAPPRVAPRGATPRTFADLRTGPLADRSFETLPEFAVAAVVEAGYPVGVVASIFRVPSWRLEAWVRDGVTAPVVPAPLRRRAEPSGA